MITSIRGCVTHNDLWPWPISSRSFRHELILSLFGTNDNQRETVCCVQWPLTLTYIFEVNELSWLCNETAMIWHILLYLLCSTWSSRWILFSCDQAALWMVQSVRPSVRLSVCLSVRLSVTPFWLCSHHRIIMKFSGVITSDKSDVHAKGQGQRSKVKVTEVTTQLNRFRTVTPVWIHMWWWNDAYSLIMLRIGALLFFKVIRKISRSHGSKNHRIWPRLGVSGL